MVESILSSRGFTVETYSDCASARKRLTGDLPDLVVTDILLPDGSGLDLLEELRDLHPTDTPPTLVLSGSHSEEEILRAYEAGASDFLTKPFHRAELLVKCDLAMRRSADLRRSEVVKVREAPTIRQPGCLRPGHKVADRYAIAGHLEDGAFGEVYVAQDLLTDTPVALKFPKLEEQLDPLGLQRFQREIYTLAALRAPGVVRLLGSGTWGERRFLAMELISGETLAERIAKHGPLMPDEALELLHALAKALVALEAVGIVHRDIKPSNIVLRDNKVGDPVLIDFGLAKHEVDRGLTIQDLIQGTPGYIAPELIECHAPTHWSDQFCLGPVTTFALTGHDPHPHLDGLQLLRRMSKRQIPIPYDLPPGFELALRRITQIEPAHRFPSASALVSFLDRLRGQSETTPPQKQDGLTRAAG